MEEALCFVGLRDRTRALLDQILEAREPSRGPRDFPEPKTDRERLEDLIRKTVRASVEITGGYHEGGQDPWVKWIIPGLVTLIVMGIGGAIVMYGQLSALTQKVENLQSQVNRVEKIVEPRYRGQ